MSADNAYFVWPNKDKDIWYVSHGFMSPFGEDCQYLKSKEPKAEKFANRELALVFAHDRVAEESIVEYGVYEVPTPPSKPCGTCYTCTDILKHNDGT